MERVVGTVIRIPLKSLHALIATFAVTATAFGQGYPLPSKSPNTPVVCNPAIWSACIDADAGKITPGWDLPVQNFTGRFLDSERTRAFQQGFRDARGLLLRVTSKRIYMVTGSGVLAYDVDRFFSRLAGGEPLVASTTIPVTGTWRDSTPENLLKWDQFFNAEGSGWRTPLSDGWQRLFDVDSDDRGYVYLAYSEFGWGVVKDNFDTSGWMQSVFQGDNTLWPVSILSVKTSDGRYFAIVSQRGVNSQLWFMGDANGFQHVQRPNMNFSFARGAKSTDGSRVAIVDWAGNLSIYRSDDLVNGGAPIVTFNGGFTDVASDGTNFFGIWAQPFTSSGMVTLTPSGSTYSRTDYNFSWYYYKAASPASNPIIRYGGNLLAITGYEPTGWNVHLFQLSNLVPTEVVGRNGVPTRFFGQYYFGLDGFLKDQSLLYDAVPVKSGGKIYLVVAAWALADVWELAAGNSLAARMKAPTAGPYYGDKITFTTFANSNPTVNWNFGDGGTASVGPGSPGYPDVTHQYSGLTEATLPANGVSYQVVASNAADSTATDSLTLQLKAPQVGFMVQGHPELLFRQADASSPAPIVSGDQFVDVGDGVAGGHYVDWSSTAVGTAQTGAGGSIGVGACGAYQVIYTGHYGPFDPSATPFSIAAGSDAKYSINSFNYTVRPFAMAITRSVSNTLMTFTPVSRLGAAADLVTAGNTGCTYLWQLMDSNNAVVNAVGSSATLATIPPYQATKMTGLVDGPMHLRLTVTVDPAGLLGACSGFNTVVSTLDFDGTLVGGCGSINDNSAYVGFYGYPTGCTPANNANTGCSTSDSVSFNLYPQNGWTFSCEPFTYAWNFGDGGQPGSGRQPSHSYSSNGTFNVSVVITDGSGKIGTIRGSVIVNGGAQPNPNPNPGGCASLSSQSAYVGFYGSSTGCTPASQSCNTSDYVTFTAYAQNNYSFTCSPYSYYWSFGDGQSSTASQPSHQYLSGGTYNVSLALQDGQGHSATISGSIRIAGGSNVNPPPNPSGCAPITPTSAYVGFYGGGTGCTPANDICTNGETIAFTLYPQNGYSFICSPYSYVWSFGDSKTSTDEQPTHQYATAGTYNISVSIRDSVGQSTTISGTIKVGSGSGAQPPPTPHRRPSGHH